MGAARAGGGPSKAAAPRGLAIGLLWLALSAAPLGAQSGLSEPNPDPAAAPLPGFDALVLSTGSSRGLAHAGVLLGLERHGYDPDLVVGTSMGAVIGALYAAGYTAERIWDLALATGWGDLFSASPIASGPEGRLLFPNLTVGLGLGRLEVSSGFIPEWRVNRFLVRLLFDPNARARSDFDRLPRRYRSVAADLSTGEEVVLARGDLARAVRASMGTPGFFAATRWGSRLLVDGGIADYLPVSVARGLGASRVVAVDVSRPPAEVARTDPASLAGRSVSLLMRNALPDTAPPDVLIVPSVDPDFPGAVFPDRPRFLLDLGLDAAREAVIDPSRSTRPRVIATPPARLARVDVEATEPALAALARRAFASAVGEAYRPAAVLLATDRLYDTGLFGGVWPRVERRGADSADVLVVSLDPRPRLGLSASAGYENDRGGRVWGLLESRRSFAGAPLEARLGGGADGLERWLEASLGLHAPGLLGAVGSVGVHRRRIDVPFFGGSRSETEVRRDGGWAGVRYRRGGLLASAAGLAEWLDSPGGSAGFSTGAVIRISSTLSPALVVGVPRELALEMRRGVRRYELLSGRAAWYAAARALKLAAVIDASVASGDPTPDVLPTLGERHGMPGLRWGEERARARLLGGLDAARPLWGSGWSRVRLRAGAAPDSGDDLRSRSAWIAGAALEGGWATPLGPVQLGWGINTRGARRIDLSLGGVF